MCVFGYSRTFHFCCCDLDLDQMTLMYELCLNIWLYFTHLHTKTKVSMPMLSNIRARTGHTHGETNTQADRQTRSNALPPPCLRVVIKCAAQTLHVVIEAKQLKFNYSCSQGQRIGLMSPKSNHFYGHRNTYFYNATSIYDEYFSVIDRGHSDATENDALSRRFAGARRNFYRNSVERTVKSHYPWLP